MNIMDLYSGHLGQSEELDKQVERLRTRVREQVERAQEAVVTRGMLELIVPPEERIVGE